VANPPDDSLGEYIRGSSSGDTGTIWSRQGAQFYNPPGAIDPIRTPKRPPKGPKPIAPYVPLPKDVQERNFAIDKKVKGFFAPVLVPIEVIRQHLGILTLIGAAFGMAWIFLLTNMRFETHLMTAATGAVAGGLALQALFWVPAIIISVAVEGMILFWIMLPDLLGLIFWSLVTAALFAGGVWITFLAITI